MDSFDHKNVLITGGSSGIGSSLAKILVSLGANVWITGRRPGLLASTSAELEKNRIYPDQSIGRFIADVANFDELSGVHQNWIEQHGYPDLLINSAGVSRPGKFVDLPIHIFQEMMAINYLGIINYTRLILPGMLARGNGHIVNISSVAGFLGTYGYTAYGASKFAVRGFSDALRSELIDTGVSLTIVFPPDTNTPQLAAEEEYKPPVTKMLSEKAGVLDPEIVADKIILAVRKKKYICTPGFEASLMYALTNGIGGSTYFLMDMIVRSAMRRISGKKGNS